MTKPEERGKFYDFEQLKAIPILDVCRDLLGLELEHKHNGWWCKLRGERTASALLHVDKNTFYDFGISTGGDNIELVKLHFDIDKKEAIQRLAEAFHIQPRTQQKARDSNELADWEWERLGLYADVATKNFVFDAERMSIERMYEISEKYKMPMNELRKKHPKTYERLLKEKAFPFMRQLRNEYYLSIWGRYQTAKSIGNTNLFFAESLQSSFAEDRKFVEQAERALGKAIEGTNIPEQPKRDYDPAKVLESLTNGAIKPTLTEVGYPEMMQAKKDNRCEIEYRTVDYDAYMASPLKDYCPLTGRKYYHSAFLKAGKVVVGYLSVDEKFIGPVLDTIAPKKQPQYRQSSYNQSRQATRQTKDMER